MEYRLFVSWQENEAFRVLMTRSPALCVLAQELTLSRAADFAITRARDLAPEKTGRLRESIGLERASVGLRVVAAMAPYSRIQEIGGTIPGTGALIFPKRAKALRFVKTRGPEAGQVKYRKWVRHHAVTIKGKGFMRQAAEETRMQLPQIASTTLAEVMRRAGIEVR